MAGQKDVSITRIESCQNFFFLQPLGHIVFHLLITNVLLSHLCRKQVHRVLMESRPWKPFGHSTWSEEVPMEQQICRTAAARFRRAGWVGDSVQSQVCHKKNIHYPNSHIVSISDVFI